MTPAADSPWHTGAPLYADRREAGAKLARLLANQAIEPAAMILALPRGGVPVAFEVASALRAPLDVLVVRKLGAPGHEELAIGALASGGAQVINDQLVARLGVSRAALEAAIARESAELKRRERVYRPGRAPLAVAGRTAVIVDDGVATGATVSAAVAALRSLAPVRVVVAVPVGATDSLERIAREADEVVCPAWRDDLSSVGQWYRDFSQTSDAEVVELLTRAAELPGGRL